MLIRRGQQAGSFSLAALSPELGNPYHETYLKKLKAALRFTRLLSAEARRFLFPVLIRRARASGSFLAEVPWPHLVLSLETFITGLN